MLSSKLNKSGYLYLLITVIIFSTYEVVSKTIINAVNPFQINCIRFFIGGAILFVFLIAKSDIKIGLKDFIWVSVLGILNVVISMNLLQLSLYVPDAKASVTAVLFSSNPIFVMLFSSFLEKEKVDLKHILGIAVGFGGIIIIFFNKIRTGLTGFKSPLLVLSAALVFGLYTVIGRRVAVRIGSLKMNAYAFLSGSLLLLPVLLAFRIPVISFDYSGIWQVLYLSVICTGFAYLTYFKGLETAGASKGSMVFFIKPVLASFIAVVFLGEHITLNLFAGTMLVLVGIFFAVYKPKKVNNQKEISGPKHY